LETRHSFHICDHFYAMSDEPTIASKNET